MFYEGYFYLQTKVGPLLKQRFPQLKVEEIQFAEDGSVTWKLNLSEEHKLPRREIQRFLNNTLGGYGFRVQPKSISANQLAFYVTADSITWATFIITVKKAPKAVELPPDLRKAPPGTKIGLVIDDFGYAFNATIDGFLNLPFPFSVAIIPGRAYSKRVAQIAAVRGKEVMLHMPMLAEDGTTSEPGLVLKPGMSPAQVEERLSKALSFVPGAVGINNHQGSGATADSVLMRQVMMLLKQRGLFFIDSRTTPATVAERLARKVGVPVQRRKVFLDETDTPEAIKQMLWKLARLAQKEGQALGIGHCHPLTLQVLQRYLPALTRAGFKIVPASQLVK